MRDPPVEGLRRRRSKTNQILEVDLLRVLIDGDIDGGDERSLVNKLPRPGIPSLEFCAERQGVGDGYHLLSELIRENAVRCGGVRNVVHMMRYKRCATVERRMGVVELVFGESQILAGCCEGSHGSLRHVRVERAVRSEVQHGGRSDAGNVR